VHSPTIALEQVVSRLSERRSYEVPADAGERDVQESSEDRPDDRAWKAVLIELHCASSHSTPAQRLLCGVINASALTLEAAQRNAEIRLGTGDRVVFEISWRLTIEQRSPRVFPRDDRNLR
jgi:hypothetical protein